MENYHLHSLPKNIDLKGKTVFIVRYLTDSLKNLIKANRRNIKRLIYLMDDDLLDVRATSGLSLRYRWKVFWYATRHKSWIKDIGAEVWVCNEHLARKYRDLHPRVVLPYPLEIGPLGVNFNPDGNILVFYHSTYSYRKEFEWLAEVVRKVTEKKTNILFEIIANKCTVSFFKNLKNVILFKPMSWRTYLRFSIMRYRHIGLAPMFDTPFNRGRSYTKFFDITRAGGVGIYSAESIYAEMISSAGAGMVLPMEVKDWVEVIIELARNKKKRQEIYQNALRLIEHLKQKSEQIWTSLEIH
ncbi:glycosyltransferase family 1 protein [Thermosulfurimonas dismutans]|uniref:glycosyltransferase family 1 protein n=1 Tax=Thermosulfurimonas dismutans TaxID=999894 RepID=UPI0012947CA8|nr:glycosyltransferase family 1 protein [Thermosulfurimonas dismutans]